MTQNAIEITGLRKTYAGAGNQAPKLALDGVDLTIPTGSIFGLLGPNGAGKSTLINILAGLVRKSEGNVQIWGFDQDVNPRQSRASIGVMPQELNMDPFFTPRAALEVQAGLYGVPKAQRRTDKILAMIGLEDKADAYARSLSGGMRRRLLLGKALVHGPQVLVLDEPTAGVDIELRQMLWQNVRRLNQEEGLTVILTTHYLEEAQELCDTIAIINNGEVAACEPTERLLSRIDEKTLVIRPISPLVEIPEKLRPFDAIIGADGCLSVTYEPRTIHAEELLGLIKEAGIGIQDLTTKESDLEDIFLKLTYNAGALS